ncbi:MAG: signal peptidase II [Prevotella sp.]|nr:signal peptidase II [Prevotella sp.]
MAVLLIIAILLVDQIVKIWVKTHLAIGDVAFQVSAFDIDWLTMTFLENNGAAGGLQLFGSKIFLSLFRLVAIVFVGYYIWLLSTKKEPVRWGYYICMAMIFAGAAGNLIDCMFYGLCFSASGGDVVAQYVGFAGEGHYAGFLEGRVVDMFEMPFTFVWNIADAAITIGVIVLLLFYRKEMGQISLKRE